MSSKSCDGNLCALHNSHHPFYVAKWWQIQPLKHQSCDQSGHMRGRDQCWGVTNWKVATLLIERGIRWAVFRTFLRFTYTIFAVKYWPFSRLFLTSCSLYICLNLKLSSYLISSFSHQIMQNNRIQEYITKGKLIFTEIFNDYSVIHFFTLVVHYKFVSLKQIKKHKKLSNCKK